MANFVAEICNKSASLCSELLTDISHMHLNNTTSGVKNIGIFIEALAKVIQVFIYTCIYIDEHIYEYMKYAQMYVCIYI
jgi:hypothetical protein